MAKLIIKGLAEEKASEILGWFQEWQDGESNEFCYPICTLEVNVDNSAEDDCRDLSFDATGWSVTADVDGSVSIQYSHYSNTRFELSWAEYTTIIFC